MGSVDNSLLIQAVLCGIFAYLAAQGTPWFLGAQTGSFYLLSRPLVAGLVSGIIMGDVYKGITIGAAVQTVFLSCVAVGGAVSADLPFASYIGIPIAIQFSLQESISHTSSEPVTVAITLASALAVLGLFAHNAMNSINMLWLHRGLKDLDNNNIKKYFVTSFIFSQITTFFIIFTPAFLAIWLGSNYVNDLIANLPEKLLHSLSVLGGVLPALGIAILMQQTIKKNMLFIYFLTGFMFVSALHINMISLSIIGALLAYFHYNYDSNGENRVASSKNNQNQDDEEVL